MVQMKSFSGIAIQLTPLQNRAVQVDPCLEGRVNLKIISGMKYFFLLMQLKYLIDDFFTVWRVVLSYLKYCELFSNHL